jgi:FtsH-binding integral membrane protein
MSYDAQTLRPAEYTLADQASVDERSSFIVKTYVHLLGAIIAFIAIEAVLLSLPFAGQMAGAMIFGLNGYSWLLVLGGFMAVSYVANRWAVSATSLSTQYMGLGLYVVAEAIIFLPLLYVAANFGGPGVIPSAAVATVGMFSALTVFVFFTRKNFSFLGPFLGVAGMVALGVIVCSILFGFNLGVLFTVLMIGFACAYILYSTSNILHEYHIGQHVAASLALFASVALLFWYVLRLFMSRD